MLNSSTAPTVAGLSCDLERRVTLLRVPTGHWLVLPPLSSMKTEDLRVVPAQVVLNPPELFW